MPRTDLDQVFVNGVAISSVPRLVSDDQIEQETLSDNLKAALDRLDQIVTQGRAVEAQLTNVTQTQLKAMAGALADLAFIERRIIRRLLGV